MDFKIRHETQNAKSLDDVMRCTVPRVLRPSLAAATQEGEFRRVCEETAGRELEEFFDYATTTGEIDYPKYLGYAGLTIEMPGDGPDDGPRDEAFQIKPLEKPSKLQRQILADWLGESAVM